MSLQGLVVAVSLIAGGVAGVLGFSLLGTVKMYNSARKYIASLQDDLSKALTIAEDAKGEQLLAERSLVDYRQQVADWQKKPMTLQAVLTDEQIKTIVEQMRNAPLGRIQ